MHSMPEAFPPHPNDRKIREYNSSPNAEQLPGVRLGGENNEQLSVEMGAIDHIKSNPSFHLKTNQSGSWFHNEMPDGAISCATQKTFEMINPPTRDDMISKNFDDSHTILGFKSIKVHDTNKLNKTIEFVKSTFPCARVILNIRSHIKDQVLSQKAFLDIKKSDKNQTIFKSLRRENARMKRMVKMFGNERARLLDMVDWTNEETGLQYLNDVVYWLGFRDCKFNQLYHENTNGYESNNTGRVNVGPNCHYPENL
eukprot:CAMPEP_0198254442 /NCGR_PEP_ID=MMETSP1447-20131203/4737_1 /TAXON_ID=420782 /ORGANISM="Chaetoceros dichaeta, Strain CCMP1751" /LENGTH=254 /DNA_ID=CAMNT_0043940479 /DNA_START=302 /DNA_END=1067 /DNA_ORIENTATION=+